MDDVFHSLGDSKYMQTIYCNCGYYRIKSINYDRHKTTFVSHYGSYHFHLMKFGLKNTPDTFPDALDILFSAYKSKTFLVYLDRIKLFSKDTYYHLKHV